MLVMIRQRVILALPLLFLITLLDFALISLAPGDPLIMIMGSDTSRLSPAQMEDLRHALGLDQAWRIRYVLWLRGVLGGNWGRSLMSARPVGEILLGAIGPTVLLMTSALAFALVIGIFVGIVSALRRYSWLDYAATVGAFAGISVPNFFLALDALYFFYSRLGWFPAACMVEPAKPFEFSDVLWHLIMPAAVLAFSQMATYVRYARTAMLEVMIQDYITTARAKGLRERIVVTRHALRNSLLPLVSLIGLQLPGLFSGSVFIETVFSWPGIGSL